MNYTRPTTWGGNGRVFSASHTSKVPFSALVLHERHARDRALVNALSSAYGEEPEVRDLIVQVRRGCLPDTQRRWACEALGFGDALSLAAPPVLSRLPKKPPLHRAA